MASVVRANYRTAAFEGLTVVLGSISYYAHHRDRDGQLVSREGFSRDATGLDAVTMRDVIRQAEGDYYYRILLSPGADQGTNVDLQTWTRDSLLALEKEYGEFPYVAIEHRDQTDYAHVHVVMVLDKRLDKEDLENLRAYSTEIFEPRREVVEPSREILERHEPQREIDGYLDAYITSYHDDPEAIERLRRSKDKSLYR
jgi:hypothetical protein